MSTTLEHLCTLAQRELGVADLSHQLNTPFSELGMDSLGLVDFMFTVEDQFHVSIEHDRALQTPTLAGLAALVDELRAAAPQAAAA